MSVHAAAIDNSLIVSGPEAGELFQEFKSTDVGDGMDEDQARFEVNTILKERVDQVFCFDCVLLVEDSVDFYEVISVKIPVKRNATVLMTLKVSSGSEEVIHRVRELVDNATDENLMSQDFVEECIIPARKKKKPISVVHGNNEVVKSIKPDFAA